MIFFPPKKWDDFAELSKQIAEKSPFFMCFGKKHLLHLQITVVYQFQQTTGVKKILPTQTMHYFQKVKSSNLPYIMPLFDAQKNGVPFLMTPKN